MSAKGDERYCSLLVPRQGECRLRLYGDFDLTNADDIATKVDAFLAIAAGRCLAVDLAQVTFLDAHTLGVFIKMRRQCRAVGSRLYICNTPPKIRRVMHLVGVDDLLMR